MTEIEKKDSEQRNFPAKFIVVDFQIKYKLGQFEDKHFDIRECDKTSLLKECADLAVSSLDRPSQHVSSLLLKKLPTLP